MQFHDNGSLTLVFHGIKNKYNRDGFTVTLSAACNRKVDPSQCLKEYMQRTADISAKVLEWPVFLALQKPLRALSAKTIIASIYRRLVCKVSFIQRSVFALREQRIQWPLDWILTLPDTWDVGSLAKYSKSIMFTLGCRSNMLTTWLRHGTNECAIRIML